MVLEQRQKRGFHVHGGVGEQREQTRRVGEEIAGQSLRPDTFEYYVVGLEDLEVYAARESRVETLGQALADGDALRDDRVAHMVGQNLGERVVTL